MLWLCDRVNLLAPVVVFSDSKNLSHVGKLANMLIALLGGVSILAHFGLSQE